MGITLENYLVGTPVICSGCGKDCTPKKGAVGSGYGSDPVTNKPYCYECCAKQDKETMARDGKIWLYFDEKNQIVSNWPGTLTYDVTHVDISRGTGFGVTFKVATFRFMDDNDQFWWGTCRASEYNQVSRCAIYKNQDESWMTEHRNMVRMERSRKQLFERLTLAAPSMLHAMDRDQEILIASILNDPLDVPEKENE